MLWRNGTDRKIRPLRPLHLLSKFGPFFLGTPDLLQPLEQRSCIPPPQFVACVFLHETRAPNRSSCTRPPPPSQTTSNRKFSGSFNIIYFSLCLKWGFVFAQEKNRCKTAISAFALPHNSPQRVQKQHIYNRGLRTSRGTCSRMTRSLGIESM